MVLDYILAALFVLGLAGLIGLVLRKIPVLRAIDPSRAADVQQQAVKRGLLEERLRRRLASASASLKRGLAPVARAVIGPVQRLKVRAQAAEERASQQLAEERSPAHTWAEAMTAARAAADAGQWPAAERAYLTAVRQDPKQLGPYEGLGAVYLQLGEYEEAREVFEFLAERGQAGSAHLGLARVAAGQGRLEEAKAEYMACLKTEDASGVRLELARVYTELGAPSEALQQVEAARGLEPRNPKILDFYIELSIVNGQPAAAQEALGVLREVNPENQKISEFASEIRQLSARLKKPNGHRGAPTALAGTAPRKK